jgi:hypothetical protein
VFTWRSCLIRESVTCAGYVVRRQETDRGRSEVMAGRM